MPAKPKAARAAKTRKLQHLPSDAFTVHPLLEKVPMKPELVELLEGRGDTAAAQRERENWDAFCADVAANGVMEPISFVRDEKGKPQIIKGRHRWRASTLAGRKDIPALEEPAERAREIILGEAGHRLNHVSKETAAYMAVLFYPHLAASKVGRPDNSAEIAELTRPQAAALVGCSLRLIEEACATYKCLADKPAMRKKLEPLIVSGQLSLGAARAGAAGGESTAGKERRPSSYATASRTISSLSSQLREWDAWPEEDRGAAEEHCSAAVESWPAGARAMFRAALEKAEAAEAGE